MADKEPVPRRLQVATMRPDDSGRGIARLPRAMMNELGLKEGDVVELVGKRSTPARAVGPYGEVYARRKERTAWSNFIATPKHRDNDARRIMTKAVIEDLWRVWNGKLPRERRGEAFDFMEAA